MAKVTAVRACCSDECHVLGSKWGGDENKKQIANEGCRKNTWRSFCCQNFGNCRSFCDTLLNKINKEKNVVVQLPLTKLV